MSCSARSRVLEGVAGRRRPFTRRMVGARQLKTCFSKDPMLKPCVLPLYRGRNRRKRSLPLIKNDNWLSVVRFKISPGSRSTGSNSAFGGGITGLLSWVGDPGPDFRLERSKSFAKRKCSKSGLRPLNRYGKDVETTV